jgi:hypothetical protein
MEIWSERMNREDYVLELEKENGYCECPELQRLYDKRRKVEKLEKECEEFNIDADFSEIRNEDLRYWEDYRDRIGELDRANENYVDTLQDYLERESVVLTRKKFGLETINCALCDQQIGIVK